MAMKPYPAYKDSGIEWLGDVPQNSDKGACPLFLWRGHWEVVNDN